MGFHTDVLLCAHTIYCELAGLKTRWRLYELRDLCERYGRTVVPDPNLPRWHGAYWNGEAILISMEMSRAEYVEALPHELVHSHQDSELWAYLNYLIQGCLYDREQFLEEVCRLVGLMFRFPPKHSFC